MVLTKAGKYVKQSAAMLPLGRAAVLAVAAERRVIP